MVRDVCEGYTGTKKEYRRSGCIKCDHYIFFNGGGYEPNDHICNREESFGTMEIPFRFEEWIKEHWK
jgi:hypothetical protein